MPSSAIIHIKIIQEEKEKDKNKKEKIIAFIKIYLNTFIIKEIEL